MKFFIVSMLVIGVFCFSTLAGEVKVTDILTNSSNVYYDLEPTYVAYATISGLPSSSRFQFDFGSVGETTLRTILSAPRGKVFEMRRPAEGEETGLSFVSETWGSRDMEEEFPAVARYIRPSGSGLPALTPRAMMGEGGFRILANSNYITSLLPFTFKAIEVDTTLPGSYAGNIDEDYYILNLEGEAFFEQETHANNAGQFLRLVADPLYVSLKRQIRIQTKALKKANREGDKTKVRKIKKKLTKLKRQLAIL